jgi:hypothetical protein
MHFRTVVGLSLAVLAAGCGKDEVRVYEVAKETNSPASTAAMEAEPAPAPRATAAAGPSAGSPKVPWTIPPEWKERPNASGMRLASYGVTAADGRSVDISVTALGEQAGTELDNVNRWRGQLKLNPLTEDQLAMARDPVTCTSHRTFASLRHRQRGADARWEVQVTGSRLDPAYRSDDRVLQGHRRG